MLYSLLGKKVGMTQVFNDQNQLVPVTVIEAGPCPVVQVKTQQSDGYNAIQIGFGKRKANRTTQPQAGHFKKHGVEATQHLREVRCADAPEQKSGDVLTVDGFEEGQKIDVIANTKGRGFQGVVKRYGFAGGPASHGSMFHRRGGSYGMCQYPGEIYKGKEMPGHMGDKRRTVQNLEIVKIVKDKNLILVKGSVPGFEGTTVLVRDSKKKRVKAA